MLNQQSKKNAVLKPTFMSGFDSFSGGTAFVCKIKQVDKNLILTAHHLFGPACGLEEEFKWDELASVFKVMTGLSMSDPKYHVTSSKLISIPGAKGIDEKGYNKDIAAWLAPEQPNLSYLTMSEKAAKKDDIVYLYGRERGKKQLGLYKATVLKSTETEFEYQFEKKGLSLGGTSGAPILNSKGFVVAINIGGYEESGKTIGIGNPLPSIIKILRATFKKDKK